MSHYIQAKQKAFAGKTAAGERVVATFIYGGDNNVYTYDNKRSQDWSLYSIAYSKTAHTEKMLSYIADVNGGAIKMNGLTTEKTGELSLAFTGFVRMNNLFERATEVNYIFPDDKVWSDEEKEAFCRQVHAWVDHNDYLHVKPTEINWAIITKPDEEKVKGILHFMNGFRDAPKLSYFTKKFTSELQWLQFNTPSSIKVLEDILYYFNIGEGMNEALLEPEALKYHLLRVSDRWSYQLIETLQRYPNAFEKTFMMYPEILEKIESKAAKEQNSKTIETFMYVHDNHKDLFDDARIQLALRAEEESSEIPSKIVKITKLAAEKAYYKNTHQILKPLTKELKKAIASKRVKLKEDQIHEIESAYLDLERKKKDQEIFARRYKSKRNAYYGNAQTIGSVLLLIDDILLHQKDEQKEAVPEISQDKSVCKNYTQGSLF